MDKRPATFREEFTGHDHHQVAFKRGIPHDVDLDELAGKICAKWQELGLRLDISQDKLDEIDATEKRKAYRMLLHWKNTTASATLYRDLYYALCHGRVGLNNVAKEFCGSSGHGRPPSSLEHNQLPFLASPQTPSQTHQTSRTKSSFGYRPLSMKYSTPHTALPGQTCEGPTYKRWHSAREKQTGRPQSPVSPLMASRPPSRLQKIENAPTLTTEALQQKQAAAEKDRQKKEDKKIEALKSKKQWLKELPTPRETYNAWQREADLKGKRPSSERLKEKSQAEIIAKQRPREEKAKIPHNKAEQIQDGDDAADFAVDHDQAHSADEEKAPRAPAEMFDVKDCQRKLAEHYLKTAQVPTTAWSSVLQADLEQIYTRLSWVKQEQTSAGSSQKKKEKQTTAGSSQKKKEEQTTARSSPKELSHYTEIFSKTKKGVVAKRILVQGDTGIGKTTFVKKLLVDWSSLQGAEMGEERKDALRKFDLILAINLKEVSKCHTFNEVVRRSGLFPEDDEKSVDDLLCYIRKNQDKILLVFDGYDEYRTGSEAEERYGSRTNSEIYKIFHGNILRDCTVLVTTRPSRGDEIRGPADIQAEITGFNARDREDFMRKMLDNQTEVDGLLEFLRKSNLNDLARVPLLSLFFCLLWKEEKEKFMELTERKTKLYQAMVDHILLHRDRRHASKRKETDDEILAEIGKVALAGLLKGDLLFEFGQLPEKVRGEVGVVVGLFQFSEYAPSLVPKKKVSFIHKSIQEYLAAWYLICSCVPKGNLGEIEQDAATLENCVALENVFQFVCGLSDEGAMKVLEHLTSVRISDPTLDLSKTIPDVETEAEVPLFDVTNRHERFSDLVCDSFREVQSKAELLSHFLDCTDGVILVTRNRALSELMPNVKVLTKLARNCVFIFDRGLTLHGVRCVEASVLYKSFDFLNCLQTPLRVTDSSDVLTAEDFMRKILFKGFRTCWFASILCFRNGQFQFYITKLSLECGYHVKLFLEPTTISDPSDAASLCPEQSCLRFLSSLRCYRLSSQTGTTTGAVIGNCEHLSRIEVKAGDDSICYLLEQVRNPSKCSVAIGSPGSSLFDYGTRLTSVGAVQLGSLLPRFNNVIALNLDLRNCCAAALDTLVTSITHKTLKNLKLKRIILTPAATKALAQSLPEMSSLQVLELKGVDGGILQAAEMEALFGGFNKTIPLHELIFTGFSVRGRLVPLFRSLRFFPNLVKLRLEKLNMDEHDLRGLLESFQFIPNLQELNLYDNPLGHAVTSIVPHVINLKKFQNLWIDNTSHFEEDLNYVRDTVQQALPELEISTNKELFSFENLGFLN